MKTNFTSTLRRSASEFSVNPFQFGNKSFCMLLMAFFSFAIAFTVKADGLPTNPSPVKLIADYCVVPGKVRITAQSYPEGATFTWNTGETGNFIDVDIANLYTATAHFAGGYTAFASLQVAAELVVNGDFSAGNTGFFSEYGYTADVSGNSELVPEGLYGIGTDGQNYHPNFWGKEHTNPNQTGNFMIVNGSTATIGSPARQRVIWQQTVNVVPNTNYYFSAYAMNINPGSPARLQFEVNGELVGTIADLNVAAKPTSNGEVNLNNWVRFYSNPTWISGTATTAVIRIRNLNTDASGNDFGLDDISFSTLAPFIKLVSAPGTDAQTTCINSQITPIVYSVGSDAAGHTLLNLPPGVTASWDVPNYLTISGAPTEVGNYTYSITTMGTCRPITVTGYVNIPSAYSTWLGTTSTDWSNPNNWSCANVPIATTNALIPSTAPRMPSLTATFSVCKILNIQTGASLKLNGKSFTSYGGIIGEGVFKGSSSSNLTIDAAGTSSNVRFDQTTSGTTNALNNLTVTGANDSVALNTKIAVYGTLAPANGFITFNDTLILRSTSAGTARVDVVAGVLAYGSIGKVTVERYFPARRSWRLVTSPLAKTGSIFDTWQNGGKYSAGKGTYVSGPVATSPMGDNGLDWSPMNNPSLKIGTTLSSVLNTKVGLSKNVNDSSDNIPYYMFVRGDRDPNNTSVTKSNITTLSSTGKLQTGTQVFTAPSTMGGFTFVGNPYAAPVDFSKLTLNNIKTHFWVWDPYLNTEQGGFVLVEQTSPGTYSVIPSSPAGMSKILESSQAFFIETKSNGPASIIFQESAKSGTATNLTAFRPVAEQSFRVNLYHLNDGDSTTLLDGVMALFDDSFNKAVDNDDVVKQNNVKEMISLQRDSKNLTLERRPAPKTDDTLFLRVTKTTQRKYRLEFEPTGLDPLLTAFVEDSYDSSRKALSITDKSVFDFNINGDAASIAPNRFRVVFKPSAPLAVTLKTISAKQQGKNISVNWTVENELNTKGYEVEKSIDGTSFEKVNATAPLADNRSTKEYQWLDQKPVAGNNYYRVKSISTDGKSEYSKIVMVKIEDDFSGMKIFPNPASGDKIGVAFKGMAEGTYHARLVNAVGQILVNTSINHTSATSLENVFPGSKLITGIYQLVITKPDHSSTTLKVIVE